MNNINFIKIYITLIELMKVVIVRVIIPWTIDFGGKNSVQVRACTHVPMSIRYMWWPLASSYVDGTAVVMTDTNDPKLCIRNPYINGW